MISNNYNIVNKSIGFGNKTTNPNCSAQKRHGFTNTQKVIAGATIGVTALALILARKNISSFVKKLFGKGEEAAKFVTDFTPDEFDKYDGLLTRKDEILGTKTHETKITTPQPDDAPKSEVKKDTTEDSSIPKSSITTNSPASEPKNTADVKSPNIVDLPSQIKKRVEKSSNGPKPIKVVAILSAIVIAIAGVIYFIKNKNKKIKNDRS